MYIGKQYGKARKGYTMKVVKMILGEKTNVVLRVSTFFALIASTVTVIYALTNIKGDIDLSINSIEKDQIRIEEKFDTQIYSLKESDEKIMIKQEEDRAIVLEVRTQLSGIQTDLKWIIEDLKDR